MKLFVTKLPQATLYAITFLLLFALPVSCSEPPEKQPSPNPVSDVGIELKVTKTQATQTESPNTIGLPIKSQQSPNAIGPWLKPQRSHVSLVREDHCCGTCCNAMCRYCPWYTFHYCYNFESYHHVHSEPDKDEVEACCCFLCEGMLCLGLTAVLCGIPCFINCMAHQCCGAKTRVIACFNV